MKVFIDCGAYKGKSLNLALQKYKNFDKFYAFEPCQGNFKALYDRFGKVNNVILLNEAIDIKSSKDAKLFLSSQGTWSHSLFHTKKFCRKDKFEIVESIDFSKFILENFKISDYIIVNFNIEGKEYDILEKMISNGSIKYIKRIFADWHYGKIKEIAWEKHISLVKRLQGYGFCLAGYGLLDMFQSIKDKGNMLYFIWKYIRHIVPLKLRLFFIVKTNPKISVF